MSIENKGKQEKYTPQPEKNKGKDPIVRTERISNN
jgi:hypothetical protein